MKTLFYCISFFCIAYPVMSQNIFWAKSATGNQLDEGNAIAIDNYGNTYIIGQYESNVLNFGTANITNNSVSGYEDAFLAKIDINGNCLWARTIGGGDREYASAVTVDSDNSIIVTGFFESTSFVAGTETLTNAGDKDIFLIKYNTLGDVIWAKSFGSNYDEESYGISCDGVGNIYLAGEFASSTLQIAGQTLTSYGWDDGFVASFKANGDDRWANNFGGIHDESCNAITTDQNGTSYITGSFESISANFGGHILTGIGDYNNRCLFVVKADSSGTIHWARSGSSPEDWIEGNGISTDQAGNCYVPGDYDGATASIGTHTLTNANPGGSNIFVAKYNSSGSELWAVNPVSGPEGNDAYCMTTDLSGHSSISGWYTSPSVNFGGIVLTSSAYGDNIYVARYDSNGVIQNAYSFSGSGFSGGYGNGIMHDLSGNVYLTGYFEGINMSFGTTILTNTGSYDVYWTKMGFAPAGIDHPVSDEKPFLFPNPTKDFLNILLSDVGIIRIYDVHSALILETAISGNNRIDISAFPSGQYFVTFTSYHYSLLNRIVKQ